MSNALWYPGAKKTARYDGSHPGFVFGKPDKGILHTTEGHGLPPYEGGATAPNMTLVPNFTLKRFVYYQHFPFNMSARALRNASGGVQTNMDNVVQFEIVGTCALSNHNAWKRAGREHLYTPQMPAWALYDLGVMVEWFKNEHGIPLQALGFESYETLSPGTKTVRLSNSQWSAFKGWGGHQHVPENTHLDPGSINIAAIMAHAKHIQEDRDMPTAEDIAKAVAKQEITNKNIDADDGKTTIGGILTDIELTQDKHGRAISEIDGKLDTLIQLLTPKENK